MKDLWLKVIAWFKSEPDSPMGRFRMKEAAIMGVILLSVVFFFNKDLFIGWASQMIMQFAKAGLASFLFYWIVQRKVLHDRTHELPQDQEYKRQNVLAIGYALIIACSLAI